MKKFIKLFFCSILVFFLFTPNKIVKANISYENISTKNCLQINNNESNKLKKQLDNNNIDLSTPNDDVTVYYKIIEKSVNKGDLFALPEKIKLSTDNSENEVDVIWTKNEVDTSTTGIHRFEGLTKESSNPVLFLLNVIKLNNKTKPIPKTKFKVVIDPGHGGYDPGAVGANNTMEKNVVLAVSLKVGKILTKNGVTVVYTRKTDNYSMPRNQSSNLHYRSNISNKEKPNFYVSIHANSADNTSAKGIETYYQTSNKTSKKLAQAIQSELIKTTSKTNRGIKVNNNYFVLNHTDAVAVLTEIGFLSNLQEENQIRTTKYQNQCANAIATGILKSLGIKEI